MSEQDFETEKKLNVVRQRVAEGRISKLISYNELTRDNPSKERMLGRLEAYLQTGVVIDQDDLNRVTEEYKFSKKDYKNLICLAEIGVMEGLVQEPGNLENYGKRVGCFGLLSRKFFGENIK
jgi:hypothetical protein